MIKYPNFTNEQWKEIEEARARLEAYKNKIQPYPVLPEDNLKPPSNKVEEWAPKQWDVVNQMRGLVLHLQRKVNDHLDKKKQKPTGVIKLDESSEAP